MGTLWGLGTPCDMFASRNRSGGEPVGEHEDARRRSSCQRGAASRGGCRSLGYARGTLRRGRAGFTLWVLLLVLGLGLRFVGGWIALSKDGYMVTQNLALDNGTIVEGDFLAKGIIQSQNRTWRGTQVDNPDECSEHRRGALRWSKVGDFEACDGVGAWAPVKLCDRFCGFKSPPVPTLRPAEDGGVACVDTQCSMQCVLKSMNTTLAPSVTAAECLSMMKIGGDGTCRNITVADGGFSLVAPEYSADESAQGLLICTGQLEEVCVTKSGDKFCTEVGRDMYPWIKAKGIHWTGGLYYMGANVVKSPQQGWLYGTEGQIIEVVHTADGQLSHVDLHGYQVNWGGKLRIMTWFGDGSEPEQVAAALAREQIFEKLTKIPTVWDIPEVAQTYVFMEDFMVKWLWGELPYPGATRTCDTLDYDSVAFDYLYIFYNISGWETRIPQGEEQTGLPENHTGFSQCSGEQVLPAPWALLDRKKSNVRMWNQLRASPPGEPLEPVVVNDTAVPTKCGFAVDPPVGFAVQLDFTYIELEEKDSFIVALGDVWQLENEPWRLLLNWTLGVHEPPEFPLRITAPYYNHRLSFRMVAGNETKTRGFEANVTYVGRVDHMLETANATNLQFALATLEAQGALVSHFGWMGYNTLEAQALYTVPPGNAGLGEVTDAERCFLCCHLGADYDPWGPEARARALAAELDHAPLPQEWLARPRYLADVGSAHALAENLRMTLLDEEVPEMVQYHGYTGPSFVRTQFVSQYPPGTVKAPYGTPLGKRKAYSHHGLADPSRSRAVEREAVGWGMESLHHELGGGPNDRSPHGWGDGWRDGDRPGEGEHWEDGDGANDYFFPSWQIISPRGAFQDARRWAFDLDHPDLPLFSFVDAERRIVIANEITLAVPCGVRVNNTCGVGCDVVGTGLNRLQCIANVATTWCNQPVVDNCNNECQLTGTMNCESALLGTGAMTVRSQADHDGSASFRFSVGIDRSDNLHRSRDITGLGVSGVELEDGEAGALWGHGTIADGVVDEIDNGLVLSYQDPTEDVSHTITLNGKEYSYHLDRDELETLRFRELDIPIPRDCIGTEAECKLQPVMDSALIAGLKWHNADSAPWWDKAPQDKRVQYSELRLMVVANSEVLTLLFLDIMSDCKRAVCKNPSSAPIIKMTAHLMRTYGVIPPGLDESFGSPGHSCSSSTRASQSPTVCLMSLMDLLRLKSELEASRLRYKRLVFSRPRFDMAKIKRMGAKGGFEFASPDPTLERVDNHNTNTLRFSTRFEAIGEYQRVGSSRYVNMTKCHKTVAVECYNNVTTQGVYPDISDGITVLSGGWYKDVEYDLATCAGGTIPGCSVQGLCNLTECEYLVELDNPSLSHIFIDGVIDEPCPMSFNAGGATGKRTTLCVEPKRVGTFGRPQLEAPRIDPQNPQTAAGTRVVNLPDSSGLVITSANTVNVSALQGLRRRSALTPFRYEMNNNMTLDDGRTIAGTRYWYRRYQGHESGVCGTHADGTPISCRQLKLQYDALEGGASSGDETLIFTGEKILQGAQLTDEIPREEANERMTCAALSGEGNCSNSLETSERIQLAPRTIAICTQGFTDNEGYFYVAGKSLVLCPLNDVLFCGMDPVAGPAGNTICKEQKIWGNSMTAWNTPQGYQTYAEGWQSPEAPSDYWMLPIEDPTATVTKCDDPALNTSNRYAFLHIQYATQAGLHYLSVLNATGYLPSSATLEQAAARYLRMQGVDKLGNVRVDDVIAGKSSLPVTTAEKCFICCQQFGERAALPTPAWTSPMFEWQQAEPALWEKYNSTAHFEALLGETAAIEEHFSVHEGVCGWLNVSGDFASERIRGAYKLQPLSSFGKPVWKQEPGDYFLHFLPAACTSRGACGEAIEDASASLSPAWIIGSEPGADKIVAYLPIRELFYNASVYELRPDQTRLSPAALFSPELAGGPWLEVSQEGVPTFLPVAAEILCSAVPMHRYATTAVWFADPTAFGKISFPDADGTVVTTGNMHEISSVGVQAAPIIGATSSGQGSALTATRVTFGVGWRSVNISSEVDTLQLTSNLRGLPYCNLPRSCTVSTPGSAPGAPGMSCPLPWPDNKVSCVWDKGGPTDAGQAVDGVFVADPTRDDCVSMYLTHDFYSPEGGEFTSVPFGTPSCVRAELGQREDTWAEEIDMSIEDGLYQLASPPYWGIGAEAEDACPSELQGDAEACWAYREAGCKDACLRNRTCVAALQDRVAGKCFRVYGECVVEGINTGFYTFIRDAPASAFHPSRIARSAAPDTPARYPFVRGARIALDDLAGEHLVVRAADEVREPCPHFIQTEGFCWRYHRELPLQLTWNISATQRVQLCTESGRPVSQAALGKPLAARSGNVLSAAPGDSSQEVRVLVSNASNFAGVRAVRAEQAGEVYVVDAARSNATAGELLLRPYYNLTNRTNETRLLFADETLAAVEGGVMNASFTFAPIVVPHGIYSLHNISETVNALLAAVLGGTPFAAETEVRETHTGLCGETPHGATRDLAAFHCSPASRFMQLSGGVAGFASGFASIDDVLHISSTSTALAALGIPAPDGAYTFGRTDAAPPPVPAAARRHEIAEGAGYLASSYGRMSGYGMGGVEGWTNFAPHDKDSYLQHDRQTVAWCWDGDGFRCRAEECACGAVVATPKRVLGATRTSAGAAPRSNTLGVPSSADGILLSTGNLEDVTVESAAMSGLRVHALLEHATGRAAVVEGWLELGNCNSLFPGEGRDCGTAPRGPAALVLNEARALSFQSYRWQTTWVAIFNGTEALSFAARAENGQRWGTTVWRLLAEGGEMHKVNRTFSTLQDPASRAAAGEACRGYCGGLRAVQKEEAEEAQAGITAFKASLDSLVAARVNDPTARCMAALCTSTLVSWSAVGNSDPLTACNAKCGSFGSCVCDDNAERLSCVNIFRQSEGGLPSTRRYENVDAWLTCVTSLELQWALDNPGFTEPRDCGEECLPDSEGQCCTQNAALAEVKKARSDVDAWVNIDEYEAFVALQVAEGEAQCVCSEVAGYVVGDGGLDDVLHHRCADFGTAHPEVCESTGEFELKLGENGTDYRTQLHFSPGTSPRRDYLVVPHASGVVLTTGNLEAVTKEAGSMSSLHVAGHTTIVERVMIGVVGEDAASQGSRESSLTTMLTSVSRHCQGHDKAGTLNLCHEEPELDLVLDTRGLRAERPQPDGWAVSSQLSFETRPAGGAVNIDFPAWDPDLCTDHPESSCMPRNVAADGIARLEGTVITTGNLEDISEMDADLLDVRGTSSFRSLLQLGSGYYCTPEGRKRWNAGYGYSGWSAFPAAACQGVEVDFDSPEAVVANTTSCKALCEETAGCGAIVMRKRLDRSLLSEDERCVMLSMFATDCKVIPKQGQDLLMLNREAPSPWFQYDSTDEFFETICNNPRTNLSQVPGTPVTIPGYVNGDITWRAAQRNTWRTVEHSTCDDVPSIAAALAVGHRVESGDATHCRDLCNQDTSCGVVVLNRTTGECALLPSFQERRPMSDGSMLLGGCVRVYDWHSDVHLFTGEESITLQTQPSSDGMRELHFPDASGIVITTGNLYDIEGGVGLRGSEAMIISHPVRKQGLFAYDMDPSVLSGRTLSSMSGKEPGLVVRGCEEGQCDIWGSGMTQEEFDAKIDQYITKGQGLPVGIAELGTGSGFEHYATHVDFARPGARKTGVCFGECKGFLPCQRATTNCNPKCPGYMAPGQRPGISEEDECSEGGAKFSVCGCPGGNPYGKYGTSVCVMPDESHADHGRFCETRDMSTGEFIPMDPPVSCCKTPDACGTCSRFGPVTPVGMSNRISFPEATGRVITTGNVDELDLRTVRLEGLELTGFLDLGLQSPLDLDDTLTDGGDFGWRENLEIEKWQTHVYFDPVSSRITGGMRFIFGWGRPGRPYPIYDGTVTKAPGSSVTDPFTRLYMEPATAFPRDAPLPEFQQRYCVDSENFDWSDRVASGPAAVRDSRENEARCYDKREIRIADVSGLVLTTGNLHDTPSMAIPREDLSLAGLGSSFTVYGNVSLGRPASYASDPFNLAPSALPPSRTHKQTIAKLYSRVDGDVGLTFLSASAESPAFEFDESVWHIDDYGRQRVNWRTDGETKRRYSDPGPAPFGQAAPTDEQTRHALHGRLGDGNSNLWGTDMVKLSNPQGGGVDTALRAMYRGGAPMLAVTVRDVPSIADIPNALGQHFGYRSGLPVLQQRSINRPSQKDSYASVTGAAVPGQKGIALEGSHPINASWCHTEISALPLFDPVSAAKRPTLLAMFNSWLVGEGLVLPSLLAGAPFAAPAFSGGLEGLEGLRVDAAACAAFRADTAERVAGRRLLTDLGSGEWMMVRNRSDTPGAFGDACAALAYTSSTFRAVFHTADEARCERLDAIGFDLFAEVADVEECLAFCLERGDVCGGFDILTTVAHRQAGVAGECRISRGACEPESMAGALLTGSTQTAYTVAAFEQAHRPITRNCRADEDFSRPYFDPLRAAYNVPTSSGAAPLEGQIWDSELCYACCILQTTAEENAALGSDLDPVTFFDHHAPDSGYVGIDLGEGREAVVTSVRFVPRPGYPERMIGGRFQGSNARDDGYADLVTVLDRPADREYTLLYVPEEKQAAYRYLRYVGPPGAFSDVGEVEFHRGSYQSELSVMQQGNVSYFVDVDALTQPEAVHTAMLVKCAAYGFVPSMLDNEVQEILIPEAQGQMLTTGNLEDIRMEASSFGSIGVLGDATILGDVAIGAPGGSSTLQVNSRLDGASALTFAGPLAGVGAVTSLTMASMTADETAFLPDGSGTVVVGELPQIMPSLSVAASGGLTFLWDTLLDGAVSLGAEHTELEVRAGVGGSVPLAFARDGATYTTSLAVPDASAASVVTLPDASGTVLTTGNMPKVMENVTVGAARIQGGVTFASGDVDIGELGGAAGGDGFGVEMNANIVGFESLSFDGSAKGDGRTLVLSAGDPEADHDITLPDTTGTVITTATFPRRWDSLRSMGLLRTSGSVLARGASALIGLATAASRVVVNAHVAGSVPLRFDGGQQSAAGAGGPVPTTGIMMPETSRDNIITFPDVSGTVITSANLPARTVTRGAYSLAAARLFVSAGQVALGAAAGASGDAPRGSFAFADGSAARHPAAALPDRENHFRVLATGGARFVTGRTRGGRDTGAFLPANASSWYYLSDRASKVDIRKVNATGVLEQLLALPLRYWRYDAGAAPGAGASATHLGPMAQDFAAAFGQWLQGGDATRIGASDADGVVLAAVHGLDARTHALAEEAAALAEAVRRVEADEAKQTAELAAQERTLAAQQRRIAALLAAAGGAAKVLV